MPFTEPPPPEDTVLVLQWSGAPPSSALLDRLTAALLRDDGPRPVPAGCMIAFAFLAMLVLTACTLRAAPPVAVRAPSHAALDEPLDEPPDARAPSCKV